MRRVRTSARQVWLMLFLYIATTVQDYVQDAGSKYHPIWCVTQMHNQVYPQWTAPTCYKGRFRCAQPCRPALLRECEALNGQCASRQPATAHNQAYGLRWRLNRRLKRAMGLDAIHGVGSVLLLACGRAGTLLSWCFSAKREIL